jgi:hypothetical protein
MNNDKWLDVLDKVKERFGIVERTDEPIEDIPNSRLEVVIFDSPLGRIKMMRTTKPRVLDKKTAYSNRAGSDMSVQYVYSDTELVQRVEILRWDENFGDWVKAEIAL